MMTIMERSSHKWMTFIKLSPPFVRSPRVFTVNDYRIQDLCGITFLFFNVEKISLIMVLFLFFNLNSLTLSPLFHTCHSLSFKVSVLYCPNTDLFDWRILFGCPHLVTFTVYWSLNCPDHFSRRPDFFNLEPSGPSLVLVSTILGKT